MLGVGLARSRGEVPPAYFDAVTCCEAEAAELEFQTNRGRQLSRWMPGA